MAPRWRMQRDGKGLGACSQEQLVAMARDGRLRPTDLVQRDGMASWVPAGSVRGLFAAQSTAKVIPTTGAHRPSGQGPAACQVSARTPTSSRKVTLLGDVPHAVRVALGLFVVGSILFAFGIVWYVKRTESVAAIARCDDACEQAEAWLGGNGQQHDADHVTKALRDALRRPGIPEQTTRRTKDVLQRVNKRQAECAAERLFEASDEAIVAKNISEARRLLEQYLTNGHGGRRPDARRLLEEIDEATSETKIVAALADLPDHEFEQAVQSGDLPDGRVSRPELIDVRRVTALTLVARARQAREQKQKMLASERRRRVAAMAERAAVETVATLGAGLTVLRRNASPGVMQSPLLAFGADVQQELKQDLKQRLMTVVGDSDITDGVERKMLAESKQWISEIQLRLQDEIRDATRSRASRITPEPLPPGAFRRHFESLSRKTDVDSLRAWGNLKVLIARHGLTLDDIDWGEWHLANKTPIQDFSPEESDKYRRYLQLAAAGVL